MISRVGTIVVPASAAGPAATLASSLRTLSLPTESKSWRTVVSGGQRDAATSISSKPATLTSPGISRPSSRSARMAPTAIWSLAQKIAVTSGRLPRVSPCR
jgi:hypothetical protein